MDKEISPASAACAEIASALGDAIETYESLKADFVCGAGEQFFSSSDYFAKQAAKPIIERAEALAGKIS